MAKLRDVVRSILTRFARVGGRLKLRGLAGRLCGAALWYVISLPGLGAAVRLCARALRAAWAALDLAQTLVWLSGLRLLQLPWVQRWLGIARLPLDMMYLTFDFVRAVLWRLGTRLLQLLDLPVQSTGPFFCGMGETRDGHPACLAARKYGHLKVFRLLCPGVEPPQEGETLPLCRQLESEFSTRWIRLAGLGAVLAALWLVIGSSAAAGLYYAWAKHRRVGSESVAAVEQAEGSPQEPKANPIAEKVAKRARALAEEYVNNGKRFYADGRYREAMIEFRNAVQQDINNAYAHFGIGQCCLKLGEIDTPLARTSFYQATCLDPTNAEAHMGLAQLLLIAGESVQALRHAEKAQRLRPDDPAVRVLLASCYRDNNQFKAAIKEIKAALEIAPDNPKVLVAASREYFFQNRLDKAEGCCRRAIELDKDNVDARIVLSTILRLDGQLDEAKGQLDIVLAQHPNNLKARVGLAEWHASKGDLPQAIAEYREFIATRPGLFLARSRLAELLMLAGNTDEGYEVITKLLQDHPGDVQAYLVLASMYNTKGLYSLAIKQSNRALMNKRNQAIARKILAKSYLSKGDYKDALREVQTGLTLLPGDLDMQLILGQVRQAMGDMAKALETFKQAAKAHPDTSLPYIGMAQVHLVKGEFKQAIANYERAMDLEPDNPIACNNLAALVLDQGDDIDRAYKLATKLRQRFPDNPIVADTYGWACFKRGDYAEAVKVLGLAARLRPDSPTVRYHHGAALYQIGMRAEARRELEAALDMSQEFQDAFRARALLAQIQEQVRAHRPTTGRKPAKPRQIDESTKHLLKPGQP